MADAGQDLGFPDQKYLHALARNMRDQAAAALESDPLEAIKVEAGRRVNWLADYLTDKNIAWKKEADFPIDKLTLTGTGASWNAVILDRCHGSPAELRKLLSEDPTMIDLFASAKFDKVEILVRFEKGQYKVLDGMHRTIAAIREGKTTIDTFIATPQGPPKPECEVHVPYDLLRPYIRETHKDRDSLIIALRLLRKSYSNVDDLLKNRFGPSRIPNQDIQAIIQEALQDQ